MTNYYPIDVKHESFKWWEDPFSEQKWREKYRNGEEKTIFESQERITRAIMAREIPEIQDQCLEAMHKGLWIPAGRIHAGAGTTKKVTLLNCFVNETLDDSMIGIIKGIKNTMLTLQAGGGMGTDFSTLRPKRAQLGRLGDGAQASGPLPFMDWFNTGSLTVKTVGGRNGAMMATISDTHPDLLDIIKAKQTKGVLEQFNISILISDAFMQAIEDDEEWALYFPIPSVDGEIEGTATSTSIGATIDVDTPETQYVYAVYKARELWAEITRNTYEWSEPGVIFIDRINDDNNLQYLETIRCTNPCVVGRTAILTDVGYLPINQIVGKQTNVWNGFEWSTVIPFSTGNNPTLRVVFNNGAEVKCTPNHRWQLRDGQIVETKDLRIGYELNVHEFPVVHEGGDFHIDAYSQGFYCGDGTKDCDYSNLYKHNEGIRNRLVGKMYERNCESQPGYRWVHGKMLPKDFVPITGNSHYCIGWLAGLLDADGNIARPSKDAMPVIQINAKDRFFLEKIRLMLTRLGVNARFWERKDDGPKKGSNGKIYECESTACLMISGKGTYQLVQLGLKTERLDLSWVREPKGIAKVGVKIKQVYSDEPEETYCLTEPVRGTFIANGVLTHNCGEQPLPPNDACDLGHVNLARMVRNPFTSRARFDFDLLGKIVAIGQRFLDNVIDCTTYPIPEQEEKHHNTRRTGLGYTGLSSALAQLTYRYGSPDSVRMAERITQTIALESYSTSVNLAKEKGAFPGFDADQYFKGFAGRMLPEDLQDEIRTHGIRNGVLNSIAPVGTVSVVYGDVESGCEPIFAIQYNRKARKSDNSNEWEEFKRDTYTYRFYKHCVDDNTLAPDNLPDYFVTTADLTVQDHIAIQAATQKWIDASVSKTINLPEETTYGDFIQVYTLAYHSGCKGCTTYRPSRVRGSILSIVGAGEGGIHNTNTMAPRRPFTLPGVTYQIKWPSWTASIYITINTNEDGKPHEIFFASKDSRHQEWMTALTLMISAIFRTTDDPMFVAQELKQITSAVDSAPVAGRFYPSLISYIGHVLEGYFKDHQGALERAVANLGGNPPSAYIEDIVAPLTCPSCLARALIMVEGCVKCTACDYSKC